MTRSSAIKAKCLDCSCGSRRQVRCCPVTSCPIWEYRFGTRPSGKYLLYLDRAFYEAHQDMEHVSFNHKLLAELHQRDKNGISK